MALEQPRTGGAGSNQSIPRCHATIILQNKQSQTEDGKQICSLIITFVNTLDRYYWRLFTSFYIAHRYASTCISSHLFRCVDRLINRVKMVALPPCMPANCGKDFRNTLHKPSPNYTAGYKTRKPRVVPAFTIQAMQKNTKVIPPPKCGVFEPLPRRPTMFRKCYKRGEFPVTIEFTSMGKTLSWKVSIHFIESFLWVTS